MRQSGICGPDKSASHAEFHGRRVVEDSLNGVCTRSTKAPGQYLRPLAASPAAEANVMPPFIIYETFNA
jgi:hypothetical protein